MSDAGSTFVGWSGDADCTDETVTMDANKTCLATFNLVPPTPDIDYSNIDNTSPGSEGRIDGFDLLSLGANFGLIESDSEWDSRADVNQDGKIDGGDLTYIAANFGKKL